MASESSIAREITTALAQYLKRDAASISPTDRLREDLGLDSLAMIELLFKIEEHFNLEIPNEDLSRITTVADVTAYVEGKLGGAQPATARAVAPVAPAPAPRAAAAPASPPAPPPAIRPAATRSAPASKTGKPAKVTSIKAAAKRKAAKAPAKSAVNKKGSRRA